MIGDREQVYENIRTAVSLNQLNSKVEPGDPKLLREDKEALLRHYIDYRTAYGFCVKKYIAEAIFHAGTSAVGLITQVDGLGNQRSCDCNMQSFQPVRPCNCQVCNEKSWIQKNEYS